VRNTHIQSYMDLIGTTVGQGGADREQLTVPAHRFRYHNVVDAFQHLTDLTLEVPYAATCGTMVAVETCQFLRTASHLRRLELAYTDVGHMIALTATDRLAWLDFVGSDKTSAPYWPHLEHLSLSTNVDHPYFLQFLQRHANTLRSLELRLMVVDNLVGVLREIPKTLELEHVYLGEVFGQVNERVLNWEWDGFIEVSTDDRSADGAQLSRDIKAYLLRRSDFFPDMQPRTPP
jgi:hypothetical protein